MEPLVWCYFRGKNMRQCRISSMFHSELLTDKPKKKKKNSPALKPSNVSVLFRRTFTFNFASFIILRVYKILLQLIPKDGNICMMFIQILLSAGKDFASTGFKNNKLGNLQSLCYLDMKKIRSKATYRY